MKPRYLRSMSILCAGSLLLIGCTENRPAATESGGSENAVSVSSTDTACTVSSTTAASGNVTFSIKNDGAKTTEFYLLGSDGLRIVSEKENITPGASADLTVTLQPGDYFTACKPGMRGVNVGQAAFTVTGDPVELSGEDQALFDEAVTSYVNFVKNEVSELIPKTEEFAKAYMAGEDDKARELFAPTRVHYERIEPIAEALGVL
ncbi:MAG: cupredoxin domain-containing protein, partial [Propionibacteriaceae bacterium]|nr:cupredoxin domain-containing protein [Propionibacteriaceae bacterium]